LVNLILLSIDTFRTAPSEKGLFFYGIYSKEEVVKGKIVKQERVT